MIEFSPDWCKKKVVGLTPEWYEKALKITPEDRAWYYAEFNPEWYEKKIVESLEVFLWGFGLPTYPVMPDSIELAKVIDQLKSMHVPAVTCDYLKDWWTCFGWSGFKNGLLWFVNPLEYAGFVDAWLKGTKWQDIHPRFPLYRTAFGKFEVYFPDYHGGITIDPLCGGVFSALQERFDGDPKKQCLYLGTRLASGDLESLDSEDEHEEPLFKRCEARWGAVGPDEMYAHVPSVALGGPDSFEQIRVEKLRPHLSFLTSAWETERTVMDFGEALKASTKSILAQEEKEEKKKSANSKKKAKK